MYPVGSYYRNISAEMSIVLEFLPVPIAIRSKPLCHDWSWGGRKFVALICNGLVLVLYPRRFTALLGSFCRLSVLALHTYALTYDRASVASAGSRTEWKVKSGYFVCTVASRNMFPLSGGHHPVGVGEMDQRVTQVENIS